MPDTADLLGEITALKAMLIASEARNLRNDERIERLEKLVAAFKQAAFGRRYEKSDPDQFELALEDLKTAMAVIHAAEDAEDRAAKRPTKPRAANYGALPKHLPRIEEIIEPDSLTCACGGCLHCIGEDISERLDIVPAQFRVIVTRRPKYACRSCTDGVAQAADPGRHADRGDGRSCASQQIRGSLAALPTGPDLQPSRRRLRPPHPCRLGWPSYLRIRARP